MIIKLKKYFYQVLVYSSLFEDKEYYFYYIYFVPSYCTCATAIVISIFLLFICKFIELFYAFFNVKTSIFGKV